MPIDPDLYQELLYLARRTVFRFVTESARDNVTDEVAAQAVYEAMKKIEAGEDIHNVQGLVVTIATRRALDAQAGWARRRHARLVAPGDDDEAGGIYFSMMSDQLAEAFSEGRTADGVEEWFDEMAERAGLDETDRTIARLVFFEGKDPSVAAEPVGLAEKTVRNRMTAIEKAVRTLLETGDAS